MTQDEALKVIDWMIRNSVMLNPHGSWTISSSHD